MSSGPATPSIALVFGAVTPPQADVVELSAHLGCSKEVSSYALKLHNYSGKYSPGGATPITVGLDGSISLGRGATCPLLMTVKVEKVSYESDPLESYVTVSGRCWGERLFRRVVTAKYSLQKGEEIVKDLMDYYAGLSHTRSGSETVEATDTTYTLLEPADSPLWDILKYVAETADKTGVIGFDFRVASDGKLDFFPKLRKTNAVTIVDNIDGKIEYSKDILRIRNKVSIYGLADKSYPADKVDWTRSLAPSDGAWASDSGVTSLDATGAPDGGACVKVAVGASYWGASIFTLTDGKEANCELYPLLDAQFKLAATYSGTGVLEIYDSSSRLASKKISISPDATWHTVEVGVGSIYVNQWDSVAVGFDWTAVKVARIRFYFPETAGTGNFWIHGLYVGGRRFAAIAQDTASQAAYGLREYVETDEELWSDNECGLRAKSLLAYLKDPSEFLKLTSSLLDYGSSPIQGGDKVHVHLAVEGVDADFRVDSAEYRVPSDESKLEVTLNLGRESPKVADYLYGLRTHTVNVEKLSRTKVGRRGFAVATGGGGGGSASSIFSSNVEIDKASPVLNLLTSRILKAAFGFDGANVFVVTYEGDLILLAASHLIRPNTDGSDSLGNASFRFDYGYFKSGLRVAGVDTIDADGRLNINAMPRDTAGLIIEAQGAGFYPMYVNPNGRYTPAAHSHQSLVRGAKFVELDAANAVANFYDGANLKGAVGHDGANYFVVAYTGDLVLKGESGIIRPNSSASDDLGNATFPFGNIFVNGVGSFGWVNVAGFTVINSSRQLVNTSVSAASIDRDGVTEDVAIAKFGGGTRTLHFQNSRYTGYTDS